MSDWRDTVRADVDALLSDAPQVTRKYDTFAGNIEPEAMAFVHRAAQARRMSTASYFRRAVMAFAAHDAGIPFSEILEIDPRVTRETGFGVTDIDGTGFGPWEILELAQVAP